MLVNYRFQLEYNGNTKEVFPVWKPDTLFNQDKGDQKFAVKKLSGTLQFVRDDYDTINAQILDTKFTIKITDENFDVDNPEWTGEFYKTNGDFDQDARSVIISSITTVDDNKSILESIEKEIDILADGITSEEIKLSLQPVFQIYRPGSDKMMNILSGVHFESQVTPVSDISSLRDDMFFGDWGSHILVTGNGELTLNVSGHYVNDSSNIYRRKDNFFYMEPTDLGGGNFQWEIKRVSNDAVVYQMPVNDQINDGVFSAITGTDTTEAQFLTFVARIITNQTEISSQPTDEIDGSIDIGGEPTKYTRALAIGVPFGDPVYGTDIANVTIASDGNTTTPTKYGKFPDTTIHFPGSYYSKPSATEQLIPLESSNWGKGSWWFLFDPDFRTLQIEGSNEFTVIGYSLAAVANAFISKLGLGLTFEENAGHSDFFYNNNSIRGTNKHLFFVPKSDILIDRYDNPARKAKLKMSELFTFLKVFYKVSWNTESGKLILEHHNFYRNGGSYTGKVIGLDLTQYLAPNTGLNWGFGQNKFSYSKQKLPERIEFKMMDDQSEVFEGVPIELISNFVNKGDVKPENLGRFSSDIDFANVVPNDFSKNGFFFIEAELQSGGYVAPFVELQTANDKWVAQNGYASFVHAHENYHKHELPCPNVEINGTATTAITVERNRVQKVSIPNPGGALNSIKLAKTGLGEGEIDAIKLNLSTQMLNIDLRHDNE